MDNFLKEFLPKQNKFSAFFNKWKDVEFTAHPDEAKLLENLSLLSESIGMKEGIVMACFDYRDLSLAFY